MVQGGLVTDQTGQYHAMGAGSGSGPPNPTGVPQLPQSDGNAPAAGVGPGVSVTVDTSQMGPVDTLLAGTSWNREDVELVLQTISTLLLLFWAVTEVRGA